VHYSTGESTGVGISIISQPFKGKYIAFYQSRMCVLQPIAAYLPAVVTMLLITLNNSVAGRFFKCLGDNV
jgi:hypothetical protein